MSRKYWLVKQEPESYPWEAFVKDGSTSWTGIRNFQARNNLRAMKNGDLVLYYHSVKDKEIVGLATVTKEHYPDPTAEAGDWSAVDLEPICPLHSKVSLKRIKQTPELAQLPLIRHTRLSVLAVQPEEFKIILALGRTGMPK